MSEATSPRRALQGGGQVLATRDWQAEEGWEESEGWGVLSGAAELGEDRARTDHGVGKAGAPGQETPMGATLGAQAGQDTLPGCDPTPQQEHETLTLGDLAG